MAGWGQRGQDTKQSLKFTVAGPREDGLRGGCEGSTHKWAVFSFRTAPDHGTHGYGNVFFLEQVKQGSQEAGRKNH